MPSGYITHSNHSDALATSGGFFSPARQGGCTVLYKLAAQPPTTTLTAAGCVKPENPQGVSPVKPRPLRGR